MLSFCCVRRGSLDYEASAEQEAQQWTGGGATDSTSMRGDENGGSFGAHIEISHKTPHGDLISHPLQLYAYIYIFPTVTHTHSFKAAEGQGTHCHTLS